MRKPTFYLEYCLRIPDERSQLNMALNNLSGEVEKK